MSKSLFIAPYKLAHLVTPTLTKRPVQIISRPWREEDGRQMVMVRMVPGDPTSIVQVNTTVLSDWNPGKSWHWLGIADVIAANGGVPSDMLRYDGAYLYDWNLQDDGYPSSVPQVFRVYKVWDHFSRGLWHPARWESFLCTFQAVGVFDLNKEPLLPR